MKKIFILAFILVITSCSSKKASHFSYKSPALPEQQPLSELGRLHHVLITSKSFIEMKQSVGFFVEKLRANDNSDVNSFLYNEELLLKWLKDNIGKTDFKNYDEAVTLYNYAKEATSKCYKENDAFYSLWTKCTDESERLKYAPVSE